MSLDAAAVSAGRAARPENAISHATRTATPLR
jgi:hypothetical protein